MPDEDKRQLLGQLRIDRNAPAARSKAPLIATVLVALVSIGGGMVWWLKPFAPAAALAVETVLVAAPRSGQTGPSVLDASGYVVARRAATVSSKVTGKVVEVFIEEGMAVTKGQLLATIDDSIPRAEYELSASQLAATTAGAKEIEVQIEQARLDDQRAAGLAARRLTSQADADRTRLSVQALQARLARTRKDIAVAQASLAVQKQLLSDLQIRAPFSGVVVAKAAQPGEIISPVSAGGGFTRTGICTIVDMDSLEVEVDVNEAYINRVIAEQPVAITLNAYADWQIKGKVIAIIPTADRNKATVKVRLGIVQKDPRILPDMGAKVSFLNAAVQPVNSAPAPITIPIAAIHNADVDPHVFAVIDAKLTKLGVRLGARSADQVTVLNGLSGGERIVSAVPSAPGTALTEGTQVSVIK